LRKQAGGEDGGPVPMTPRQLEAMVRMSEASARVRLSNEATLEDVERGIRIVEYYLRKVAGSETGLFDIDLIASGVGHNQRDRIHRLVVIVEDLARGNDDGAGIEDVLARAAQQGISDADARQILDRLVHDGRLYQPRPERFRKP
jgi:replicative DNA helicase Mcm